MYEGYGPGGVAILIDILTNNRNRTASDIRTIFSKGGGNLGASGSVSYLFQNKGQIFVPKSVDEGQLMSVALDAGAEDVVDQEEAWQVLTESSKLLTVREALERAGIAVDSAELTMIPTTTTEVAGEDAERLVKLIDALEDNEDVQKVYANFEMSAAQLEALET